MEFINLIPEKKTNWNPKIYDSELKKGKRITN